MVSVKYAVRVYAKSGSNSFLKNESGLKTNSNPTKAYLYKEHATATKRAVDEVLNKFNKSLFLEVVTLIQNHE